MKTPKLWNNNPLRTVGKIIIYNDNYSWMQSEEQSGNITNVTIGMCRNLFDGDFIYIYDNVNNIIVAVFDHTGDEIDMSRDGIIGYKMALESR